MKALLPPTTQTYAHKPVPKPHDWHTKTRTGPWHAYCSVCERPITCRAEGRWVHR